MHRFIKLSNQLLNIVMKLLVSDQANIGLMELPVYLNVSPSVVRAVNNEPYDKENL